MRSKIVSLTYFWELKYLLATRLLQLLYVATFGDPFILHPPIEIVTCTMTVNGSMTR